MFQKLTTYTDGGARGNPGPAGLGVVIMDNELVVDSFGRYIGETTNNQAEYRALVAALERASELGAKEVECKLDSELVVKQMRREYKVKDKDPHGIQFKRQIQQSDVPSHKARIQFRRRRRG
jgi:ribonuclease HI